MHIEVLERTDRTLRVKLEGASLQMANALRRIAMSEVPVLAVDMVDFYSNDSAMYDEVIAHRLGMVPLWFDTKTFKGKDECDCAGKGCSNCQIVFVIDKKGPGPVTSKDMKSADVEVAKPFLDNVPIIDLLEGEKLKVEATARLGTGQEHAKWQASRSWYMGWPQVVDKEGKVIVETCPDHAVQMEGSGVLPAKSYQDGKCKVKGEITASSKVAGDPSRIIFTVESISGLKAEEVLTKSIEILKDKAKDLAKQTAAL